MVLFFPLRCLRMQVSAPKRAHPPRSSPFVSLLAANSKCSSAARRRLSFLNLDFFKSPGSACSLPRTSFYFRFMGITLGVTALLLYVLLLWAVGAALLRRRDGVPRGGKSAAVWEFHRVMVARVLVLLTLCCARAQAAFLNPTITRPHFVVETGHSSRSQRRRRILPNLGSLFVAAFLTQRPPTQHPVRGAADTPLTDTILGVFNCREVDGVYYLVADTDRTCYSADHMRYFRAGLFWAALYCLGIPATYLGFLVYFRVPRIAGRLVERARVLALLDAAWSEGAELPPLGADGAAPAGAGGAHSAESLPDACVDALYAHFIVQAGAAAAAQADEGEAEADKQATAKMPKGAHQQQQQQAAVAMLPRAEKLRRLLAYADMRFSSVRDVPWSAARDDPDLPVAAKTIGSIFIEFSAASWYWILVRTHAAIWFVSRGARGHC